MGSTGSLQISCSQEKAEAVVSGPIMSGHNILNSWKLFYVQKSASRIIKFAEYLFFLYICTETHLFWKEMLLANTTNKLKYV